MVLASIGLLPVAAVVGLGVWARRLARRTSAPPLARYVSYAFAVVGTLPILFGLGSGVYVAIGPVSGQTIDPSQKARALAEGISEAMNCSALGLVVAGIGALWLGFCTWRWRRRAT
jgi:hypothetical protein